jgi:cobalt-zinc-cadmium efflux system outer membrane protein
MNHAVRALVRRGTLATGLVVAGGLSGCATPAGIDRMDPPAAPPHYRATAPPSKEPATFRGQLPTTDRLGPVVPASAAFPVPKAEGSAKLDIPRGLPGWESKIPVLPPDRPETRAERLKAIETFFPPLPDLGPEPLVDPTPERPPVSLDELLEYARRNSPTIAQAAADVEQYRGQWVQAGLYPNPTLGFQGDQVGNLGTAGQIGGFFNQTIITAGKLKLARAVAYFDYLNAQLRLRRAEVELARQVRSEYYAALVAAESVRVSRLIAEFTDEVYRRQVAMLRGPLAAPFEAAALRAVVGQSRANLIAARNRYVAAWKRLAAAVNAPGMPPGPLAGRADETPPRLHYDALQDRMVAAHTDITAARNSVAQAEQTLVLERRRPVPNLENNFYFQDDNQANSFQMGVQIGVQVPVWNRNQGAIMSAKATIIRNNWEVARVRNDLLRQLADAFEQYETARLQAELYRDQILPDLARAFRGVYDRYQFEPAQVNYNDIVTAQQNFANGLNNYLQALRQQWQALSDLAGTVQADDPRELPTEFNRVAPDTWPDPGPFVRPPEKK